MKRAPPGPRVAPRRTLAAMEEPLRIVTDHRPPLVIISRDGSNNTITYSGLLFELLPRMLEVAQITRPYEVYTLPGVRPGLPCRGMALPCCGCMCVHSRMHAAPADAGVKGVRARHAQRLPKTSRVSKASVGARWPDTRLLTREFRR